MGGETSEMTDTYALMASANTSGVTSSWRGSKECPSPACPMSSSAVRPIQLSMSISAGASRTRVSMAARSYAADRYVKTFHQKAHSPGDERGIE